MTENEAIKYLRMATDEAGNGKFSDVYKEMCKIAIQALEEIQSYRAIGTIEEFKSLKKKSEAKKPYQDKHLQHTYFCSCCGYTLAESVADDCCLEEMAGWCPNCGNKLDWSE